MESKVNRVGTYAKSMHSFDNFFLSKVYIILMVVLFNNAYPVRSAI